MVRRLRRRRRGRNGCALLAEEREPWIFYGFWTYDADTVDWIIDHLERSYGLVEPR